jgi:hypothetical protein
MGAMGWLVASMASVLLAACTTSSPPKPTPSPVSAVPIPAQCAVWSCQKSQSVAVPGNYTVSLWRAGRQGDFTTHPVLELSEDGVPVQWWVAPNGYGWSGSLSCLAGAGRPPGCVLIDGQGMHSGIAEEIVLRGGRLVAVAAASSDTATILARDVDGDGELDVVALDSDYRPNFATGHLFWHTYRFTGDRLVSTGCTPASPAKPPPPTGFVTGACARR